MVTTNSSGISRSQPQTVLAKPSLEDDRSPAGATDYERELKRLDDAIGAFEAEALSLPMRADRATQYLYLLYQRAALRGPLVELEAVEKLLDHAIEHLGPAADLCLLKANLDFKFHRLTAVERDLEAGQGLLATTQAKALQADLSFQRGRYQEASDRYEALLAQDPTWDHLARYAYYLFKMGDFARAEVFYIQAEDELTAKEMRHFAWLELQRGQLQLRQGHLQQARAHYDTAARAYSGYWMVDEHRAELLGAEGRYEEAAAQYEAVIARVPSPEFRQALAELYGELGREEEAKRQCELALADFIAASDRGGVHYYHHLADLYADVRRDGPQALKWARRDISLRRNFATLAALAWALYLTGELAESVAMMEEALSSGAVDAHLFFQAATIYDAAHLNAKGSEYLHRAETINPGFRNFHVHR